MYRLWRDLGYAIGALVAGSTADALGLDAAIWMVAAITFASGLVVAVRMPPLIVAFIGGAKFSLAGRLRSIA